MSEKNRAINKTPEWMWYQRLMLSFFFLSLFITVLFVFYISSIEIGDDFKLMVLELFPNAQLWINATLYFKNEVLILYIYHLLLFVLAGFIFIYLYVLNLKKMFIVHEINFKIANDKKQICNKRILLFFAVLLAPTLSYLIIDFHEGYQQPMTYDAYRHSPGIGLNNFETWKSKRGQSPFLWITF